MKHTFSGKRSVPHCTLPRLALVCFSSLPLPLALCALCMWFLFSSEVHLWIPSKMKTKNKIRKERSEKTNWKYWNNQAKPKTLEGRWGEGWGQPSRTRRRRQQKVIEFALKILRPSRRVSSPIHRCLQPVSTSVCSSSPVLLPSSPLPTPTYSMFIV